MCRISFVKNCLEMLKYLFVYSVFFKTRKRQSIQFFVFVRLFHVQPFGFSRALTVCSAFSPIFALLLFSLTNPKQIL